METYVIYRELGHRSAFGEESLSDLTDWQRKLLNITHTYDVIQSSLGVHDSYGEGHTEIPAKIRPYPTKLLKWYKEWMEKTRKQGSAGNKDAVKTKSGRTAKTILYDDETDEEAFAAYIKGQQGKKK